MGGGELEEGAFVFETPSKISALAFASLSFLSAKYCKSKSISIYQIKEIRRGGARIDWSMFVVLPPATFPQGWQS